MPDASSEWDEAKSRRNLHKHGVGFELAQLAFLDPRRVIARGLEHSESEARFYCFGTVGSGVPTVRFTWRGQIIRVIGLATGEKERKSMKSRTRYTDEPPGKIDVVPDFLPKPEDLVPRVDTVKITVALSKTSIEFFKSEAKKAGTSYQRMIRNLLDLYAGRYGKPNASGGRSKAGKRRAA